MKLKKVSVFVAGYTYVGRRLCCLTSLCALLLPPMGNAAEEDTGAASVQPKFELHGYVREYVGVNLQDHPEPDKKGRPIDGRGQISMARSTLKLEGSADFDVIKFVAIGRADYEIKTAYLKKLEDSAIAKGSGKFLHDQYDRNELREFYATFDVGDRLTFKLGKQQVVWGETDVLRGTDIIQGYDTRWRSILENENEELRKPLIMLNAMINFPEVDGTLQLIYRPGWDQSKNVTNSGDMFGGRWAAQPFKGVNSFVAAPLNFHHSKGDTDDANYGFRWSGIVSQVNYSFLYYRGLSLDPVVNSVFRPYGEAPKSPTGAEMIFPEVDTYGFTFNAFSDSLDAVMRGEFAYTPNKPYNIAGYTTGSPLLPPFLTVAAATGTAGLAGIKEKKTLTSMLGLDKNLVSLQKLLGTDRPVFWTSQIFDTWLVNYKKRDDIVDLFGYGDVKPEHWTVFTSVVSLSYQNGTISPSLGFVYDITNKDAILIPGIDLIIGDHWRIHGDLNFFIPDGTRGPTTNPFERKTHLFGTFDNNNQMNVRVSYYF